MSTATLSQQAVPVPPATRPQNDVILLGGVTWDQYRAYRDDPENNGVRMHYADGELLLMTTGMLHERLSHLLTLMFAIWSHFSGQPIMGFGRWTLLDEFKKKGLEADNCYYARNVPYVQQKETLDLNVDPPPDLAIEIDITTHSRLKFAIYAALGVPEVWVWRGDALAVHRLEDGTYQAVSESQELPGFPLDVAARFAVEHLRDDDATLMEAFRAELTRTP
ncbi:MAG: Uma2 family endonuclease [Planctomycetaceae bacterium]|nr:Uma2 family endonuclease [Planctomycetaceae bacterium]